MLRCLLFLVTISLTTCAETFKSNEEKIYRYDQDSKEISAFLNTKNIFKTLVKLFFGTNEESTATSRQVLNALVKVSFFFISLQNSFCLLTFSL